MRASLAVHMHARMARRLPVGDAQAEALANDSSSPEPLAAMAREVCALGARGACTWSELEDIKPLLAAFTRGTQPMQVRAEPPTRGASLSPPKPSNASVLDARDK